MALWNPNEPCLLGLEWAPITEPNLKVAGDLVVGGQALTSELTENVDAIWLYLNKYRAGRDGGIAVEVYREDTLPGSSSLRTVHYPTADALALDTHGWNGSSRDDSGPFYSHIDNPTLVPAWYQGRWIPDSTFTFPIFGTGHEHAVHFGNIVGSPAVTSQVTKVRLEAQASELVAYKLVESATFVPYLEIDGVRYFGTPRTITGEKKGGFEVAHDWYGNPHTGSPWLGSDIVKFDSVNSEASGGWIVKATGSSNNLPCIFRGRLEIEYLASGEAREAVGFLDAGDIAASKAHGWTRFPLQQPAGTAWWAKTAAVDYVILMRRTSGAADIRWRYLTGTNVVPPPPDTHRLRTPRLWKSTRTPARWGGARRKESYSFALEVAGGTSPDSQPYLSINGDHSAFQGFSKPYPEVHKDQAIGQTFTVPAPDDYGFISAWVRTQSATTTEPLVLSLRTYPGGVQQGSDIVVDVEDLKIPRTSWQQIKVVLPEISVPLVAQQYRIEAHADAAPDGDGWEIAAPSSVAHTYSPPGVEAATFGGSTDSHGWKQPPSGGIVANPGVDLSMTLRTIPDPVTGLAAAEVPLDAEGCVNAVRLTWDEEVPSDCGGFGWYEIQRTDAHPRSIDAAAAQIWQLIGAVAESDTLDFYDTECRREVENQYRIRVVRLDGAPSQWSEPVVITPAMPCCGYVFASNEAIELTTWYDDLARRRYQFPGADKETRRFMGRNYAISFGEAEDSGDVFSIDLYVSGLGSLGGSREASAAADIGRRAFQPLLVLAQTQRPYGEQAKVALSYVAVCDSDGERWFASLEAGRATRDAAEGDQHIIEMTATEVSGSPSVAVIGDLPDSADIDGV